MRAINRVARILEGISVQDRTWVFSFIRQIEGTETLKVPARIDSALKALDAPARSRVIQLFTDQTAEAFARENA